MTNIKQELEKINQSMAAAPAGTQLNHIPLFPGITLCFITFQTDHLQVQHEPLEHILEINYCHAGRMGWQMGSGHHVYLGPGDFSIHMMETCALSAFSLPTSHYEGITLYIDLSVLEDDPPELFRDTSFSAKALQEKYCKDISFTSLAGTQKSQTIFEGFYAQSETLQESLWKLKALETLLYLAELTPQPKDHLTEYQSEQIHIIHQIQAYLTENLQQRITIDELSRQYPINPTTLKQVFKSVYGTSIAAYVTQCRMTHAAKLLRSTDAPLSEIAHEVGYSSQSKFSAAFKKQHQILPSDYRRNP